MTGGGLRMTLIQDFDEVDLGVQDSALEVTGEKEIASSSDMKNRTGKFGELYITRSATESYSMKQRAFTFIPKVFIFVRSL